VDEALKADLLQALIQQLLKQEPEGDVELSLSEKDVKALTDFCVKEAKASGRNIELKVDSEVLSGFKVTFKGSNAYLDYTGEALAEALGAFLRPELAKIVSEAATEALAKA
jgi:V/A-type H+-transporting ATPase subunit E